MSILKRPKTAMDRESTLMSKLLDKNSGYFEHIMDKCVCSKCTCGQCKCSDKQLKEQKGMPIETNYQREFTEKQGSISNLHHLPEYKDSYKMKFDTTNRTDYKQFKVRPQTAFRDQKQQFLQPFHAASSYQLTYTKMPESEKVNIIPQNHPTVMTELQFLGDTEYKRRFSGRADKKEPFVNFGAHSSFSNPINTPIAFYGQTTSQRAFRPFKSKKIGNRAQNQDVQNIPSFYSQYDTTMKRDFSTLSLYNMPRKIEQQKFTNLSTILKVISAILFCKRNRIIVEPMQFIMIVIINNCLSVDLFRDDFDHFINVFSVLLSQVRDAHVASL